MLNRWQCRSRYDACARRYLCVQQGSGRGVLSVGFEDGLKARTKFELYLEWLAQCRASTA